MSNVGEMRMHKKIAAEIAEELRAEDLTTEQIDRLTRELNQHLQDAEYLRCEENRQADLVEDEDDD